VELARSAKEPGQRFPNLRFAAHHGDADGTRQPARGSPRSRPKRASRAAAPSTELRRPSPFCTGHRLTNNCVIRPTFPRIHNINRARPNPLTTPDTVRAPVRGACTPLQIGGIARASSLALPAWPSQSRHWAAPRLQPILAQPFGLPIEPQGPKYNYARPRPDLSTVFRHIGLDFPFAPGGQSGMNGDRHDGLA
jgi:hypothetical protein